MKVASIPGSGLLSTVAGICLGMLYFIFGFALFNGIPFRGIFKKASYTGVKAGHIILTVLAGMVGLLLVFAILFRINYWPGDRVVLFEGIMIGILISLITGILQSVYKKRYLTLIQQRLLPLTIVCILLMAIPVTELMKLMKPAPTQIEQLNERIQSGQTR